MTTQPGAVQTAAIRRYSNLTKLGSDWKGRAFRGRLDQREHECVIVELARELTQAPGFAERFTQAGAVLERLDHPGLAHYVEFRKQGESYFVVTDLVEGVSLADWAQARRPGPTEIVGLLCAVLEALEHAHGRRVAHLALAPGRILVTREGRPVVTDVGLAALLGNEGRSARDLEPGAARRHWPYQAPEALEPDPREDYRADVYACGVLAYELLTGRLPIGIFDMPGKLVDTALAPLDEVLAMALAADPARRYQRAAELAAALAHALQTPTGTPREERPFAAASERASQPVPAVAQRPELAGELATLTLDSDPPAARITDLSGAVYGDTPLVLKLPAGAYSFCFRLPEPYVPVTEDVTLIAGSSARVVARPPKRGGEILVSSQPPGAEVLRNGDRIGVTPLAFTATENEAGELVLKREGYHEAVLKFQGRSAQKTELRATLKPRLAVLEVASDPVGADILDERLTRMASAPARLHLDSGKRRLTFRYKGYEDLVQEIEIGPGEERPHEVKLTPKPGLVEISSSPSLAQVWRDGQAIGVTSLVLTLPGKQPVPLILRLPGYRDLELTVTAEGGARTVMHGHLELAAVEGLEPLGAGEAGFAEFKNAKDGSTLVFIPSGPFTRGSEQGDPDEKPVRSLLLGGYYIAKTPVTVGQYRQFLAQTGHRKPLSYPGFDADEQPIVGVDWNDAVAYCAWAGLRLPTEAEWEKAARGLDDRIYPWGDQPPFDLSEELKEKLGRRTAPRLAAFGMGAKATSPVGTHREGCSPFGCLDMSGNVWEWCADWHDAEYYARCPEGDPPGPDKGNERICRGGAWSLAGPSMKQIWQRVLDSAAQKAHAWRFHVPRLAVTTRGWYQPTYRFNNLGFRPARSHP